MRFDVRLRIPEGHALFPAPVRQRFMNRRHCGADSIFRPILLRCIKRIGDHNAGLFKVGLVSRQQMQAVTQRGCSDEAVGGVQGPAGLGGSGGDFTPQSGDGFIDRQDTIREMPCDLAQPDFQLTPALADIQPGNTVRDLANRDHAEVEAIFINRRQGFADGSVSFRTACFGENGADPRDEAGLDGREVSGIAASF